MEPRRMELPQCASPTCNMLFPDSLQELSFHTLLRSYEHGPETFASAPNMPFWHTLSSPVLWRINLNSEGGAE